MGEKGRVNTAIAILSFSGGLIVYSAVNQRFQVPAEMWGVAVTAAAYLFTTARRGGDDDDGNGGSGGS
jgi:hypothetical protein